MALIKFLQILSVVSLAILHASLPVDALSVERHHVGRDFSHVHAEIAKKRDNTKKCRPRPSSAPQNYVAPTTTPTTTYPPPSNPSESAHTTTSSQPASTYAPSSSVNSKIMYAWSNFEQPSLPHFLTGSRRFMYNWHMTKYSDIDISTLNVEFVPTVARPGDVYQISSTLKPGYAKYAKFFNEPEVPSQANVGADVAHQLWMQYFLPLASQGYKLVSPAVTNGGLQWMKDFLAACDGKCSIYALDMHFYGLYATDFTSFVNEYHNLLPSVPVWITECGCHDYSGKNQPCTQGVFDSFFPTVMSYVESTSWIEQMAWFGFFKPGELPMEVENVNGMIYCPSDDNKECKPNSLGYKFINYH